MKKLTALLLALTLLLAPACGGENKDQAEPDQPAVQDPAPPAEQTPPEDPEPEPEPEPEPPIGDPVELPGYPAANAWWDSFEETEAAPAENLSKYWKNQKIPKGWNNMWAG